MSKRVSVVEPPLHDSIPEANEHPTPTPRRSHSNPDHHHHPQRPPKPVRTTKPPALSTTPTPAAASKTSVPPSPARQRVSKPISNPRLPQQSLDAAAQLLASRPSDLSRRPAVPGPVDHQIGRPSITTPERRPRLTTEIPPATATASASAAAANGYTSLAVPPLPRRTATAPAEDGRTRLRRHTNASTRDITISSPILDHGQPYPFFFFQCWPVFLI